MNHARAKGCDVGAEPKDGVWWTYLKGGRTKQVLGSEMSPGRCELTELTCVGSRHAPEHSKPPMFLQISLESFMFDALGYKS